MEVASPAKFWPISSEPIDLAVSHDQAAVGLMRKDELGDAGDRQRVEQAGDHGQEQASSRIAGRSSESMIMLFSSPQARCSAATRMSISLDADERDDDAAHAVDQEIAAQERRRAERPILHAAQRQRDQRDDDQRIEDDRREDRALAASRGRMMLSAFSSG